MPPDQAEEGITAALATIGECLPAERVSLVVCSVEADRFETSHEWTAGEGAAPAPDTGPRASVTLEDQPWLLEQLGKFEVVSISGLAELPHEAGAEREALRREGVQSAIFVPMVFRGTLVGFMKIESHERERRWPHQCQALLRIALDLIVSCIERRRLSEALRQRELRLRRTQRLEVIGRLARGVAHDFNNFLTAIVGYSDLLEADLDEAAPGRVELHEIRRAADRASALAERVLSFGRQGEAEFRVVDLSCVVTDLIEILQRATGEDAEVVLDLRDDLPSVRVDPARVDQALINLAVNAVDAMSEGGKITISTGVAYVDEHGRTTGGSAGQVYRRAGPVLEAGGYVVVSVRDDGCGVDASTHRTLFEPLFTTKSPGVETGLGLATVASIMEECAGGISVETELGRGIAFHLYFPVLRDTVPGAGLSSGEIHDEQLSGS